MEQPPRLHGRKERKVFKGIYEYFELCDSKILMEVNKKKMFNLLKVDCNRILYSRQSGKLLEENGTRRGLDKN